MNLAVFWGNDDPNRIATLLADNMRTEYSWARRYNAWRYKAPSYTGNEDSESSNSDSETEETEKQIAEARAELQADGAHTNIVPDSPSKVQITFDKLPKDLA